MKVPLYVVAAILFTATGELEALLQAAPGNERAVSIVALPLITLPLIWVRRAPVLALATMAGALLAQGLLGGFLAGGAATTLGALALALYAAGRENADPLRFAWAAVLGAAIAGTRIAFDPAAQSPRDAALTFVAVACPLVVGRWARGQSLLQSELATRVTRRARDRERDARHAAEDERARIAADLQAAVADGLRSILGSTGTLRSHLLAAQHEAAKVTLTTIAGTARSALADVRRVLGVLRHDGEGGVPLAPPRPTFGSPGPPAPAVAAPVSVATAAPPGARCRQPDLVDRLVAAVVLALGAVDLAIVAPAGMRLAAPLTAIAVAAPLLWRRRWPLPVALAVLATIALQSTVLDLDSFPVGDIAAMVAATYALGAYADRRTALAGLALTAAGAATHAAVFYPDGVVAAVLGGAALPWVIGRIVHSNRQLSAAGQQRSLDVERRRESDARAAVISERMRVARELHDAVAHTISVIAIQAASVDAIVDHDPERTERVVDLIETITREALAEIDRIGVNPEDDPDESPSLGHIDRLARRAKSAGVSVDVHLEGRAVTLPAGIDLAAFRIVQEALANTAKHANADHAWVTVRYAPRAVELEIGDHGRGSRGPRRTAQAGGGHGLVGMRERVVLYHGSLDVGPQPGGGYLVRARLPVEA